MQFSSSVSLAAVAISSLGFLAIDRKPVVPKVERTALVGSPQLFEARYAAWKEVQRSRDVRVPLAWSRAISTERTSATGRFVFDAQSGRASVIVEGIPADARYEAWLVDDAAGTSAAPD